MLGSAATLSPKGVDLDAASQTSSTTDALGNSIRQHRSDQRYLGRRTDRSSRHDGPNAPAEATPNFRQTGSAHRQQKYVPPHAMEFTSTEGLEVYEDFEMMPCISEELWRGICAYGNSTKHK